MVWNLVDTISISWLVKYAIFLLLFIKVIIYHFINNEYSFNYLFIIYNGNQNSKLIESSFPLNKVFCSPFMSFLLHSCPLAYVTKSTLQSHKPTYCSWSIPKAQVYPKIEISCEILLIKNFKVCILIWWQPFKLTLLLKKYWRQNCSWTVSFVSLCNNLVIK